MSILKLSGDVQSFLLRAAASLERIDTATEQVILLTRNLNEGVSEIRQIVRTVVTVVARELDKPEIPGGL